MVFTAIFQCMSGEIQELSITPAGTSRELRKKFTPMGLGCPTGTILHGKNEVFQSNRYDFPKVTFYFRWNLKVWGDILQLEVNKMA
jgi:hypothetical protein